MNTPGRVTALELLLALGLPLLMLLVATWLLERRHGLLPPWLQAISRRQALLWNGGVALLIAVGAMRYVLEH